jgi:hypothetical protein
MDTLPRLKPSDHWFVSAITARGPGSHVGDFATPALCQRLSGDADHQGIADAHRASPCANVKITKPEAPLSGMCLVAKGGLGVPHRGSQLARHFPRWPPHPLAAWVGWYGTWRVHAQYGSRLTGLFLARREPGEQIICCTAPVVRAVAGEKPDLIAKLP